MENMIFIMILLVASLATKPVIASSDHNSSTDYITVELERISLLPTHAHANLDEMRGIDQVRFSGIANFSLGGTYDSSTAGLYYATLRFGTSRTYSLQVDTGSDISWINCASCETCPKSTLLPIPINFYDPSNSSTATQVGCSDMLCQAGIQESDAKCVSDQCIYVVSYADHSVTNGHFVSDVLHLDMVGNQSIDASSSSQSVSAPIIFGCSRDREGPLRTTFVSVDGILGLGYHRMSIISQLHSLGVTPKAFSFCLSSRGGGSLVFGEIVHPDIVYTPMSLAGRHYGLFLEGISVGGQNLPINSNTFKPSKNNPGTLVDTGSTFSYLTEEVYELFISSITASVLHHTQEITQGDFQCYEVIARVDVGELFPSVIFRFSGGASLTLTPQDYLISKITIGSNGGWCIGFLRISNPRVVVLGDIVIKDKVFIFDLLNQRIGWTTHDCTKPVNISTTQTKIKTSHASELLPWKAVLILLHLFLLFSSLL